MLAIAAFVLSGGEGGDSPMLVELSVVEQRYHAVMLTPAAAPMFTSSYPGGKVAVCARAPR